VTARSITTRLLSPTGFVLAGLCVFLPFGAVSCDVAPGKTGALTYTGVQLIGHTGGKISVTPQLRDELGQMADQLPASTGRAVLDQAHADGVRYLLIAVLAVVLFGAASAAIRSRAARHILAIGAALASLTMLVGAQIAGRHAAETWFRAHPETFGPTPGGLPAGVSVRPELGFWLAAGLLIVVGVGSLLAALRSTDDPAPGAEAPEASWIMPVTSV